METAIGVIVAQTTAFGSIEDKDADNMNQKINCVRRFPPTNERNPAAILLSRPTSPQETVSTEAPSSSRMVSEA